MLARALQLGTPGGAVLGKTPLEGSRTDREPPSHSLQGRAPMADGLTEHMLEVLIPGGWRRRQDGRIPAQDAKQVRVGAGHREVQVAGAEGEGRDRRAEVDAAGAEGPYERFVRAGYGLGKPNMYRSHWLSRTRPDQGTQRCDAELQTEVRSTASLADVLARIGGFPVGLGLDPDSAAGGHQVDEVDAGL